MKILRSKISILSLLTLSIGTQAQIPTTLREAAAKANLNIGMAVADQIRKGDQTTMNILKSQCNMLVNENEMKFEGVEPTRGKFTFDQVDTVVKFAEQNGMKMRGHNLLWDFQIGWAKDLNTGRADILNVIKTHIDSVVGHFKGRIREWDVVNEPIVKDTFATTLRPGNVWMRNIGPDYIDSAFVYAHRADPDAKLFINEFFIESINSKYLTMYKLVKGLKERGIPIHGVGLQCHGASGVTKDSLSKVIRSFGDLGLLVSLTEIDIGGASKNANGWNMLMNACLENANCQSYVTWGVDDNHSWRGSNCDCLLYTGGLQPKMAIDALIKTLNGADPTIAAARKAFGGTTGLGRNNFANLGNTALSITPRGISYTLLSPASVRLELFGLQGRKISTLINARQTAGTKSLAWNKRDMHPGPNFVRLEIDGKHETRMIMKPLNLAP